MKVLITDLTRMYDGHICAAGIDVDSGRRVRPVNRSRLPASMLASRGGVFAIGNVVDIGRTAWRGSRPEIEDVLFNTNAAKFVRSLPADQFMAVLRKRMTPGLSVIGGDLVRDGISLVTPQGAGLCSLVIAAAEEPVQIVLREMRNAAGHPEPKIRFVRADGVDLSVTDVRLYQHDLITPDTARVAWLQKQLVGATEAVLCFGLGRPYNRRHFLQLNNVHPAGVAPAWPPSC